MVIVGLVLGLAVASAHPIAEFLLDSARSDVVLRGDVQTLAQITAAAEGPGQGSRGGKNNDEERTRPSNHTNKTVRAMPPPRARGDDLRPVHPNQDVLNAAMGDDTAAADVSSCVKHHNQHKCIVDVSCGWCLQPEGKGQCVVGTYHGPSEPFTSTVYCPTYITYQVYIPPGPAGSEDAFKNMFDSLSGSGKEHDFDSDLLSGLDNADATPTKPDIPHPDIRNDYGLNEDKMDLGDEADAEDVSKKAAAKERVVAAPLPKPAKMRVKSIEPHTTAAVPQDDRATGYGAETSPCGLPGVPQEFCDAWLKTHCGPDQLTDEHIKNMRAANNPYDWCKLLFENEPGITLPEVDVFPWMINNQEVDLSEALQDKIRFGHPLASQGVSWDKVDSLNLIRPRRQENPPPPPLAAVIVEE